jgi:hypothetical protein
MNSGADILPREFNFSRLRGLEIQRASIGAWTQKAGFSTAQKCHAFCFARNDKIFIWNFKD